MKDFGFPDDCKQELVLVNFSHIWKQFKLLSKRSRFASLESTSFAAVSAFHGR
jgi:hypothetical protein